MAKTEKLTGLQLEQVIDLANDYNLFDFIFEEEDSLLSVKEWEVYSEYLTRLKQFASQNKDNKKAEFATSGQEDEVIKKLNLAVVKRDYENKKTLLKKENRPFIKDLAKILNPETNLNDLKEVMQEVTGKLMFLKESFRSM